MLRLFKKKAETAEPTIMVSFEEIDKLREKICVEYGNTAAAHKKPTEYMRGLQFALDAIEGLDVVINS